VSAIDLKLNVVTNVTVIRTCATIAKWVWSRR